MFVLVVHSLMDSESNPCAHDGHNKDQQDSCIEANFVLHI